MASPTGNINETKTVEKLRYLEKYMAPKEKRKKKKTKPPPTGHRLRILDDDVDLKQLPPAKEKDESGDDDVPVIASVIDDRPLHLKVAEQYQSSQWKTLEPKEEGKKALAQTSSRGSPSKKMKTSESRDPTSRRRNSDSDLSPNRHHSAGPKYKSRKETSEASSKRSPSKKTKASEARGSRSRKRHDSDSGLSPDRKQSTERGHKEPIQVSAMRSPSKKTKASEVRETVRRKRHDSDSDLSPGRIHTTASQRPGKQPRTSSSDGHVSLPGRHNAESDQSPTRKGHSDSDLSPVRKRGGSDSDLSPPRVKSRDIMPVGKRGSDSDLSPVRKRDPGGVLLPPRPRKDSHKAERKTKEKVKVKKEKEEEKVMEVIKLRDSSKANKAKASAAREEERKEVYDKWGKGLAQQEQQKKNLEEHLHETSKPFSRYEDDVDLEKHLKDQERAGDPMLKYIKKNAGVESKRPRYSGPEPPPNRYSIRPGYRWDGVNRSNGFEKRLVELKNSAKANEEEAYKWSVEDM